MRQLMQACFVGGELCYINGLMHMDGSIIAIGVAVGVAVGMALNNLAVGIGIGVAIAMITSVRLKKDD